VIIWSDVRWTPCWPFNSFAASLTAWPICTPRSPESPTTAVCLSFFPSQQTLVHKFNVYHLFSQARNRPSRHKDKKHTGEKRHDVCNCWSGIGGSLRQWGDRLAREYLSRWNCCESYFNISSKNHLGFILCIFSDIWHPSSWRRHLLQIAVGFTFGSLTPYKEYRSMIRVTFQSTPTFKWTCTPSPWWYGRLRAEWSFRWALTVSRTKFRYTFWDKN
jgi:hypothetical protein